MIEMWQDYLALPEVQFFIEHWWKLLVFATTMVLLPGIIDRVRSRS